MPYPPNFNKIPAKIIDPPTGASTWALGNHWWKKNIGNFTKNEIIIINIYMLNLNVVRYKKIKFIDRELYKFIRIIININKGNEANNVYINK